MLQVARKTVGEVDAGRRNAGKGTPGRDTWFGLLETLAKGIGNLPFAVLQLLQGRTGATECAGHVESVARTRATAQQCPAGFDKTMRLQREGHGTARGIAANELHCMLAGQRRESSHEGVEPGLVDGGECHGKRRPGGLRPHGSKITEIDGQHLPAEAPGVRLRQEMPPRNEGVHGHSKLPAGRDIEQGAVIAAAQRNIRPRDSGRSKEVVDQRELTARHEAVFSNGRSVLPSLSSTPLT